MQTRFEKQFKDYIGAYLKCPWKRRLLNNNRYTGLIDLSSNDTIDITHIFKKYVDSYTNKNCIEFINLPSGTDATGQFYTAVSCKLRQRIDCNYNFIIEEYVVDSIMSLLYDEIIYGCKMVYVYKVLIGPKIINPNTLLTESSRPFLFRGCRRR